MRENICVAVRALPHVGDPVAYHGPLGFVQMAAVQVLGDDGQGYNAEIPPNAHMKPTKNCTLATIRGDAGGPEGGQQNAKEKQRE